MARRGAGHPSSPVRARGGRGRRSPAQRLAGGDAAALARLPGERLRQIATTATKYSTASVLEATDCGTRFRGASWPRRGAGFP